MRGSEREKYTYKHNMGDELYYQISSSKYKNTFHEVYIGSMCNGAHVCVEYRYKCVNPILNEHGVVDLQYIPPKYKILCKALWSTLLTRFSLGNYKVTLLTN